MGLKPEFDLWAHLPAVTSQPLTSAVSYAKLSALTLCSINALKDEYEFLKFSAFGNMIKTIQSALQWGLNCENVFF